MNKILTATAALVASVSAHAVTVVKWDFDAITAPSASTTWSGIGASEGTGTASGVHTSTTTWSTPAGNGSAKSISANTWAVGNYWQFSFSTLGFTGLTLSFDQAGSNTGPRDFKLAYSADGVSFNDFAAYTVLLSNWSAGTPVAGFTHTMNLSALTTLNNTPSVTLRLIDTSTVSINGGTVASGGTNRVDNFVVNMAPIPEPATYALWLAGLGVVGFVARRRRRD